MATSRTRRSVLAATTLAIAVGPASCRREHEAASKPDSPRTDKTERFAEKLMEDIGAAYRAPLSYIGDRLGLFKVMASSGPVTAAELAQKTGLNLRYIRAWLESMTTAEYIEYHPDGKRFVLPAEHAAVLADEESPHFMGGALEGLVPVAAIAPRIKEAFHTGKGVPHSAYPQESFESMARWSAPGFKHRLVQEWLPAMPTVQQRLRAGGTAADIGCGQGVASIVMAKAFTQSRFWGYDSHRPSIERARAAAENAGVADRVIFEVGDGAKVPPRQFDFISTFDVLHDSIDPQAIVSSARAALAGSGSYLASEPSPSPNLEDNINSFGRLFYPAALLYCMSVSLAQGGAGIGSDINEEMVRRWGQAAGFKTIRTLPLGGGFLEMRHI
jgi:2-polyprenyl-3-methyl-5-hydroxy-6-metoxy-1,4-benzoquinol methylase